MNTKDFYEKMAETHNAKSNAIAKGMRRFIAHDDRYELMISYLNKELGGKNGLKVLDVGCGDGAYEKLIKPEILRENEFYGLDISDLQRAQCNGYFVDIKEMNFDYDKIPFSDKFFDYVICSEVIEHLFYPENISKEIMRVIKNNGIVIVTTPNLGALQNRLALLLFGTSPFFDYMQNKQHIRFYTKKSVNELFFRLELKKQIGISGMMFERFLFPVRIILPYFIQYIFNKILPNLGAGLFLIYKNEK